MPLPLNINLIIPFKDKRGGRLNLYRNEIATFRDALGQRVEELKGDLLSLFGTDFPLTIAARSDGNARKYYWRFKSSHRNRKYLRLHADPVVDYLRILDRDRKLRLREIEKELIFINANLKLVKGILDSIEQSTEELRALSDAVI